MAAPRVSPFKPEQLWQQAREPMFWLDAALRLAWVNRSWEALTGHSAAAVVGIECVASGPSGAGEASDLGASFVPPPEAIAGHPAGTLSLIVQPDGGRLWRRLEFWPFRDEKTTPIGLLGLVREPDAPPSVPDSQAHQLRIRLLQVRVRLHERFGIDALIGTGSAHRRLLEQVRLAALARVPVLITGDPGTGKRTVARIIHRQDGVDQPLILVDCEAMPADRLEAELFEIGDHEASCAPHGPPPIPGRSRARLRLNEGSTLVIGDILNLSRDLQARLVEALDGSVRLIATTAGDVDAALKSGQIRADLYHALTVLVMRLPPLRERRDDLMLLAQHLLERINRQTLSRCGGFTPQAAAALLAYDWPGNLLELSRVIEAAYGQAGARDGVPQGSTMIDVDDLPAAIRGSLGGAYTPPRAAHPLRPLDELLTEIERRLIETALARARQNKSRAAEFLGISRPRLYRRIKELNLPDENGAEGDGEAVPAAPAAPAPAG
jgi:DNA-binding NtrC family response regulator